MSALAARNQTLRPTETPSGWDDEHLFDDAPKGRAYAAPAQVFSLQPALVDALDTQRQSVVPSSPVARRSFLASPWLWGVLGFLFGIVFWHMIGFWSFMSETLLPSKRSAASTSPVEQGWTTQGTQTPTHTRSLKPRIDKAP